VRAAAHPRQEARLAALRSYDILDTPRETDFDEIAQLASAICEAPISVVNLIDADRQWFKAEVGLGVRETPLETSLCSHVILESEFVEIIDTLSDPRMCDNPLCLGDRGLRYYAGALLQTPDGLPLGTLCILDYRPRALTGFQKGALQTLSRQVMAQLDLRLALQRQKILLKEIDHRVKNSLQSIAAILRLQLRQETDARGRAILSDVSARVANVALLHEHLYAAEAVESVEAGSYLAGVAGIIQATLPEGVRITVEATPTPLDPKRAAALGMLVSEFIANSVKHAFAGRDGGTISFRLEEGPEGTRILICRDDGPGMPQEAGPVAMTARRGIGMRLIEASATQLGGEIRRDPAMPGFGLSITFPV
jgi:two-component sensor histidine kinase